MQSCSEKSDFSPTASPVTSPVFGVNEVCSTPCESLQEPQGDELYPRSYKKERIDLTSRLTLKIKSENRPL